MSDLVTLVELQTTTEIDTHFEVGRDVVLKHIIDDTVNVEVVTGYLYEDLTDEVQALPDFDTWNMNEQIVQASNIARIKNLNRFRYIGRNYSEPPQNMSGDPYQLDPVKTDEEIV